ncbi:hypothetical protein U879_02390 [Defluviimonas sp. 20V17]|uniref:DUF6314 domain-containing protein n=1 Tax=Allgaiera indica TaxID=765699 RepID=A0AAN4UUC0_9RHOB|nr:DUF6314 family protein [Allgaiera indica]KDB05282.1 hypothetical protein U879_02390 [Defluviimonas sp. 20V17]GHE04924.1 hypothetical protein GCM10008024_33930 [Allgaiera indica]SDX59690.1 hypothetical protein SAMN05444006_12113 [Allgaiera indica]
MRGLAAFEGTWRIIRRIDDRLDRQSGRFEGIARLTPCAGGLRYREEGVLRLGAAPAMNATRSYLWRAEGAAIAVHFEDDRLFHRFDPTLAHPAADHACDPDSYNVLYDFSLWPEWRAVWNVTGPRKAYRMESTYRRG